MPRPPRPAASPPLHQRALLDLERFLDQSHFPPGTPLPGIRTLAAQLGYSRATLATAIHALAARGQLSLRGQTLLVADASPAPIFTHNLPPFHVVSFVPNPSAAAVAARFGSGTIECLMTRGTPDLRDILDNLLRSGCDGLLLDPPLVTRDIGDLLVTFQRRRIPVVIIGSDWPGPASRVTMDHDAAATLLFDSLQDAGHSIIGCIAHPGHLPFFAAPLAALSREAARRGLPDPAHRSLELPLSNRQLAPDALVRFQFEHPEPTALIALSAGLAASFLAAARILRWQLPARMSLVAMQRHRTARSVRHVVAVDTELNWLTRIAAATLLETMADLRATGLLPPHQTLRLSPRLFSGTTLHTVGPSLRHGSPSTLPLPPPPPRGEATWTLRHPQTETCPLERFHMVDLAPHVNRSATRPHGWLGAEPLRHLAGGARVIHGVPFRILRETRSGDRSVVAVRSKRIRASGSGPLPLRLRIPLNQTVESLYFLLACGWAHRTERCGEIEFELERSMSERLPLIAQGHTAVSSPLPLGQPNLQDWWPSFPILLTNNALPFAVLGRDGLQTYERYLYSVRWDNPRPSALLRSIALSGDPSHDVTFLLLALTARLVQAHV